MIVITRLFLIISLLFGLCSCMPDEHENNRPNNVYQKWFIYDKPINGYDVKIHWISDFSYGNNGRGDFYFTKGSITKTLTDTIDLDRWICDLKDSSDTIILSQYYDESLQPYLDWRTFVGFADYNFDGHKDLVICNSPWQGGFEPDYWLDCDTFTIYEDTPDGFVQIHNEPFDRLTTETCRLDCDFDVKNQQLIMTTSIGACCLHKIIYHFQNGQPYKRIEINHEETERGVLNDTIVKYYDHKQ